MGCVGFCASLHKMERQSHTTVIHTAGVDSGVRPSLYLVELSTGNDHKNCVVGCNRLAAKRFE